MIVILEPNILASDQVYREILQYLSKLPGIQPRTHKIDGMQQTLTEIYLLGNTAEIDKTAIEGLPGVESVVRISRPYAVLGRHQLDTRIHGFTYNGIDINQDTLHIFAGLCAVDSKNSVAEMMRALQDNGLTCTRMGAYKPRTSPYSFQGLGSECLPWVFELAGKFGIKIIAMEVTHDSHVDDILNALESTGNPTGVMLQVGTRNTQNFELLKKIGRQNQLPVLIKRGFGITLDESLNAAEYLASEGARRVIFCLRGMKSNMGDPHRNFVDFSHVPVVKRLTLMPVGIDPSHSVGSRQVGSDGVMDLLHATAQGVIAGANLILADFHPFPEKALVDGPQALRLDELPRFVADVQIAHDAYRQRKAIWAEENLG